MGRSFLLIYSGIAAASRRGCPASGGPRHANHHVPNASGGRVCALGISCNCRFSAAIADVWLQLQVLGCNCRCSAAYSAAIADARLQLQMFNCNCRCSAAIADARGCNCRYSAAIADARLQLQNYSVAIADSKYTLQALRPRGDRSKNSSVAIADCKCTLQAPRPREGVAPHINRQIRPRGVNRGLGMQNWV